MGRSERYGGPYGPPTATPTIRSASSPRPTTMSPEANGPIRCLLGMLGADVHSNGVRTLARRLRDRGIEVVYIGEHNTVQGMVETAAAEDVDVVGVSFWNPGYLHATRALVEELASAGLDDVTVMVG